jgi:hypothetical protein
MALELFVEPWPLFQFLDPKTVGRTPWTGDQPVVRPLPTHRTTLTQNKRTQKSRILCFALYSVYMAETRDAEIILFKPL